MKRTLLLSSILLLLATTGFSQDNEVSSGEDELPIYSSGSGDGSGDDGDRGHERPMPSVSPGGCDSIDVPYPAMTVGKDEVTREAVCHVACLEEVIKANWISSEAYTSDDFDTWRSVSTASLHGNCELYQQVHECSSGCLLQGVQLCASDCYDNCADTAEYSPFLPDSGCQRKCSNSSCELGCSITITEKVRKRPPLPDGQLQLEPFHASHLHGSGIYRVNYTLDAVPTVDVQPFLTAYIVEVRVDGETPVYYWMASLQDPLVMDEFLICRQATVSFFPVNAYGKPPTQSNSVSLAVYKDEWPSMPDQPPPYSVQFSAVDDTRAEYVGHSIVTVTWSPPNRGQYLTGYKLEFKSPNKHCGASRTYEIEKDEGPTFTWRSEGPRAGPIHTCQYDFKISSLPTGDSFPGPAVNNTFAAPEFSLPVYSDSILTCTRLRSRKKGFLSQLDIDISWTIPNNLAIWRGLDYFRAEYFRKDVESGELNKEPGFREEQYKYGQTMFQIIDYSPYTSFQFNHIIELFVHYSDGYLPLLNSSYTCEVDGRVFQPTPPSTINVDTMEITKDGRLSLSTYWDPSDPDEEYSVERYILYAGTEPLTGEVELKNALNRRRQAESQEFVVPDSALLWLELIPEFLGNNVTDDFDIDLTKLGTGYVDDVVVYVQVVSIASKRSSNWTAPVALNMTVDRNLGRVATSTYMMRSTPGMMPSTSASTVPDVEKGQQNLATIASAIAPVLFFLIIAIVVAVILLLVAYTKNRRLRYEDGFLRKYSMKDGFNFTIGLHSSYLDDWEVSPNDVVMEKFIGEGSYGEVYRGYFTKRLAKKENKITVLVKYLRTSATDTEYREFYQQLQQYKVSSAGEDPYILRILGCISATQPSCAIMEYPEGGDLLTHLVKLREEVPSPSFKYLDGTMVMIEPGVDLESGVPKFDFFRGPPLCPAMLINYARQIASAMDCLSGLGIVHRDLACRNVFIDENNAVKVTDFGVAPLCRRDHVYPMGLPLRWMALESILDHTYTVGTDVWAFGVTMWEIVTFGGFPYQDTKNESMSVYLQGGGRLPYPSNCSAELYTILSSCWDMDPNRRPSFQLLHETISNQLQKDVDSLVKIETPLLKNIRALSPMSSIADSAIGDCPQSPDLGVVIELNHGVPMVTNPTYRHDSLSIPKKTGPTKVSSLVTPTGNLDKQPHPSSLTSPYDLPIMDQDGATEV